MNDKRYLLVYYTEGKYLHHLRRNVEYFDIEEDLMEFLDKKFSKIVDLTIYEKRTLLDISNMIYNKIGGNNE